MEIEQVIKISQLYDFYSDLLSDKQKQYLNDYYFNDLSLINNFMIGLTRIYSASLLHEKCIFISVSYSLRP